MKRELEISPSHVPARLRLAEAIVKEEQFDEAFRLADEAVKVEPNNPRTHQVLSEVLVAKGDLQTEIRELELSRQQSPKNIRAHWGLLRAYTSAGRADDAKQEKEQIERLGQAQAQP
jgi:tetratricopeptide (TPR) repeat protein